MNNSSLTALRLLATYLFLILAVVSTAGCSSSKSKVGSMLNLDTDLKLTFKVAADINPDDNNQPSPLFVRFYQLKSAQIFEKTDFIDIFERDQEAFGADIVSKQQLKAFAPGESRTERFVLNPGVRYIAIYAEFSQYTGAAYKVVFPVTENNVIRNQASIQISGKTLTLVKK